MPPAAATAAGRRSAAVTDAVHAPSRPRRVSGPVYRPDAGRPEVRRPERSRPARPAVRPSVRAAAAAAALETVLAPAPRRVSRETPRRLEPSRRLERIRELPRLDRIVRGRAWIPLLGVMLVAIVGLRVEVLKLGSSVGRELQQATTLQSSNALLRSQVSQLSDNRRIAKLAEGYGMVMPNALDIHFVQASAGADVSAAIGHISVPSPSTFLSGVASERQTDAASSTVAANTSAVGVLGGGATGGTGAGTGTTSTSTSGTSSATTASTGVSTAYTGSGGTPASTATTYGSTGAGATSAAPTYGSTTSSSTTSSSTASVTGTSSTAPGTGTGSTGVTSGAATPPTGSTTGGASLAG